MVHGWFLLEVGRFGRSLETGQPLYIYIYIFFLLIEESDEELGVLYRGWGKCMQLHCMMSKTKSA